MWNPPDEGWVKCNIDVGFNNHLKTTNKGWCVRDSIGRFLTACVTLDVGLLSIIEVEVVALKEAIQSGIGMNLNYVIFESDS